MLNGVNDFATFQKGIDAGDYKGMMRSAWQMDYPSIENFLAPIYTKGADSNWAKYDSPEFQSLLTQAAAAATPTRPTRSTSRPRPSWARTSRPPRSTTRRPTSVGPTGSTNVKITPFGTPDLSSITVK